MTTRIPTLRNYAIISLLTKMNYMQTNCFVSFSYLLRQIAAQYAENQRSMTVITIIIMKNICRAQNQNKKHQMRCWLAVGSLCHLV